MGFGRRPCGRRRWNAGNRPEAAVADRDPAWRTGQVSGPCLQARSPHEGEDPGGLTSGCRPTQKRPSIPGFDAWFTPPGSASPQRIDAGVGHDGLGGNGGWLCSHQFMVLLPCPRPPSPNRKTATRKEIHSNSGDCHRYTMVGHR